MDIAPVNLFGHDQPYFAPTFMFYSRSPDKSAGYGADESIHHDDLARFHMLNIIRDWRKKLSNFYSDEGQSVQFRLDGHKWFSVEHYFHAQKFAQSKPELYYEFTMDSQSELSIAAGPAVKRAGRTYKLSADALYEWDNGGSKKALRDARNAKFRQNDELRNILILTSPAILTHRALPRAPLIVEHNLMNLREILIAESKNI